MLNQKLLQEPKCLKVYNINPLVAMKVFLNYWSQREEEREREREREKREVDDDLYRER